MKLKKLLKGVAKTVLNPAALLKRPLTSIGQKTGLLKKTLVAGAPVAPVTAPVEAPLTTLPGGTKTTKRPRGSKFAWGGRNKYMSTTGAGKAVDLLGGVAGTQAADNAATAPAVGVPEIDKQAEEERKRKLALVAGKARTVLG